MTYTVHESAIVDSGAQIGKNTRIWHFTHVCGGAQIGEKCSLGQNVFIGNDVTIGNNVKIQNNVSVYDAVYLEDDVFCGPSMVFTNVFNPRSHVTRKHEYRQKRRNDWRKCNDCLRRYGWRICIYWCWLRGK